MSKDSSPQGCQTDQASSGAASRDWKAYITKLRQAYSLRVKSGRLTSASGFLSWPTAATRDFKGESGSGRQERKGNPADTLPNAVAQWPTPQANEIENPNKVYRSPTNAYRGNKKVQPMLADVCKHGPAAPANPSTLGSRPESLWRTPSVAEEKNQNTSTQIYLQNQVGATPKAWATPSGFMNTNPAELERNSLNLGMQAVQNGATGKLNPRWVETLMGIPIGWTMPSCASPATIAPTNSDSSETELSPQPQSELFEC
jgi:hypothetical protein